jgi:hypothetical protein
VHLCECEVLFKRMSVARFYNDLKSGKPSTSINLEVLPISDSETKEIVIGQVTYLAFEHVLEVAVQSSTQFFSANVERFKDKLKSNNYDGKSKNITLENTLAFVFVDGNGKPVNPQGMGSPLGTLLAAIFYVFRQHLVEVEALKELYKLLVIGTVSSLDDSTQKKNLKNILSEGGITSDDTLLESTIQDVKILTGKIIPTPEPSKGGGKGSTTTTTVDIYRDPRFIAANVAANRAKDKFEFLEAGIDVLRERKRIAISEKDAFAVTNEFVALNKNDAIGYFRKNLLQETGKYVKTPMEQNLLIAYPNVYKCNTWIV